MYKFEKCCWCMTLRTGAICIGILQILLSLSHSTLAHSEAFDSATKQYIPKHEIIIIYNIIFIVIDSCLLYGAFKDARYFLLPWLILYGSCLVVLYFVILGMVFFFPILLLLCLFLAPSTYFWAIIWSLYVSLDSTRNVDSNMGVVYNEPPSYEYTNKYPEVV